MNTIVIISLTVPLLISFVEIFLDNSKRRIKWLLFGLSAILLGCAFFITKDDAKENEELKATVSRTEHLTAGAKVQIEQQSRQLTSGFSELKNQLAASEMNGGNLIELVRRLENSANALTASAATLTGANTGGVETVEPQPVSEKKEWLIDAGDKTSRQIDNENQFAVKEFTPNAQGRIVILVNGYSRYTEPGGQTGFPRGNKKGWLIFKGVINDKYVFYVNNN